MSRGASLGILLDELKLRQSLPKGSAGRISGLMGPARSLAVTAIVSDAPEPALVVVPDERRLAPAVSDLEALLAASGVERRVMPFPAFALDPYRGLSPHLDVTNARVEALAALLDREPVVIVATAAAFLYRTATPELLRRCLRRLEPGTTIEPAELELHLVESGYRHEDPVVTHGDFARRGGIVDLYPPGAEAPLRLELLGDEVEEIRSFDPETQRTTGVLPFARIAPASEWPVSMRHADELDLDQGAGTKGLGFRMARHAEFRASALEYLDGGDPGAKPTPGHPAGLLVAEEPAEVLRAAELEWERVLESYADADDVTGYAEPAELLMDLDELGRVLEERAIALQELGMLGEADRHVSTTILPSYRGRLPEFLSEIGRYVAKGSKVRVFVPGEGMADRSIELLAEAGLSAGRSTGEGDEGHVVLENGHLSQGFHVPELSLAVFTASDVFREPPRPKRHRGAKLRRFLSDFRDLAIGDFVVHTEHGIGVFAGLKQLEPEDATELVVLEYGGGDKLYVPVDKLDYLEKYSSAESAKPRLDKLGGTGWARVKKRVRRSMRDMAQELLKLYAARKRARGHAFASDSEWMREFEALFEFEETPDQLQAIEDVRADMESGSPMDRLLCGDVGYGKTEVAMRASFKAVSDGMQVAVLVPTTVLAFQHLNTFRERFAPFPVRVEMLSRFRSRAEQKQVVAEVAAGKVDIVIGTHRLLSKDVSFDNLGLLVVDEEQRFGVTHKERLKKLRHGVDALALSATPIPRTLHMSLSGIRDLSVIETPPKDRMAIQTHITRLDAKVITEAIRYELGRGGQVFFVHNRVSSIYSLAAYLARLVPEARIIVGHGQMKEAELEKVMLRFIRQESDILVSTTIVENGLDIPLVNTLMVNRADRFGLSQLYQLRGRVGRSDRRAYAYLLVPEDSHLTPLARRRLAAIKEFSELGAGFRIAALDLELRGAGNLLGGEQHGHIDAVGFDLYCRLLEETVQELSSEDGEAGIVRAELNLRLELRLPDDYVPDVNQRMSIYKRASSAREPETVEALQEETRDRYGPVPEGVRSFFRYAGLQILADEARVAAVEREKGGLRFRLTPATGIDPARLFALTKSLPAKVRPEGDDAMLHYTLPGRGADEVLSGAERVLREIAAARGDSA